MRMVIIQLEHILEIHINSQHKPFSKKGCLLFVKLRQFNKQDDKKVVIDTLTQGWAPGLVDGLQVMPLHNFESENTALVKWQPNTIFNSHQHFGGEEIFVIEGTFMMSLENTLNIHGFAILI